VPVKVATSELLLDSLLGNPNVKAAVLVDDRGYVIDKRGMAACLKIGGEGEQTAKVAAATARKQKPTENLYLVQAGDDFLIVVFDDRMNFERIKASVDTTLAEFDMAPDSEE